MGSCPHAATTPRSSASAVGEPVDPGPDQGEACVILEQAVGRRHFEALTEDQARLADLVKGMNAEPNVFERTKFQRRLLRAIRFAERRTPAPDTPASTGADQRNVDADEIDRMDGAVERFMAGEFQFSANEPFGLFKDPIISDLRSSFELPASPRPAELRDLDHGFRDCARDQHADGGAARRDRLRRERHPAGDRGSEPADAAPSVR